MSRTTQRELEAIQVQSARVSLDFDRECLKQQRIETARLIENAKRDGIPLTDDLKQ